MNRLKKYIIIPEDVPPFVGTDSAIDKELSVVKDKAKKKDKAPGSILQTTLYKPVVITVGSSDVQLYPDQIGVNAPPYLAVAFSNSGGSLLMPSAVDIFNALTLPQRVAGFTFTTRFLNVPTYNMSISITDPNILTSTSGAYGAQGSIDLIAWNILWVLTNVNPPIWNIFDLTAFWA